MIAAPLRLSRRRCISGGYYRIHNTAILVGTVGGGFISPKTGKRFRARLGGGSWFVRSTAVGGIQEATNEWLARHELRRRRFKTRRDLMTVLKALHTFDPIPASTPEIPENLRLMKREKGIYTSADGRYYMVRDGNNWQIGQASDGMILYCDPDPFHMANIMLVELDISQRFEDTLRSEFQEDCMASEDFARDLYSALCDNLWTPADIRLWPAVEYGWREAAENVVRLMCDTSKTYLSIFHTGREGEVTAEIRERMRSRGWTALLQRR